MYKGIFLLVTFLSFNSLIAENTNTTSNNIGVNYRFDDAVTFTERGIEFHVFLDGGFDFSTNQTNNVYHDYNGNITRIGNAVINYNFNGNVSSIGNVAVRYSFGQLSSVGNLNVDYDRWGYPHFSGFVQTNRYHNSGLNININLGSVCAYDDVYFYNRNFRNNYRQFREDNNFFYYRAVPNANIGNRNQILKRRKPNRTVVKSNNRYLKNNRTVNSTRNNTTRSSNRNTKNNRIVRTNTTTVKPNNRNVQNNSVVRTTRTTVKPNTRNNKVVKTTKTTVKSNTRNNKVVKTTKTTVVKNNKRNTKSTSNNRASTNKSTTTSSSRRTK